MFGHLNNYRDTIDETKEKKMPNPFADSHNVEKDTVKDPMKDQSTKKSESEVSTPLKETAKMTHGFEICEDGSILVGTPQINNISRSKRQTFVDLLSYKHDSKVIFYGEGSEIVGDLFIDEFLNDECVNRIILDHGSSILELGREYSLRFQISKMKNKVAEYDHFKLFNPKKLSGSKNSIYRIVKESRIGIITCFFHLDQLDSEPISKTEAIEYLEILEACDVDDYNIPVVSFIEAFDLTDKLIGYADIVIFVDVKYEEDRRIEVTPIKPNSRIFEPFYLYQDGTFVKKSDSLNSEIMDKLGKRVIHPEE